MAREDISANKTKFKAFVPEITDKLQVIADTYLDKYDEHQSFDYLIAELFETTNSERFVFTDGAKDGGIDFFVKDSQNYTICQCKCPATATFTDSGEIPTFDQSPIEELKAAIDMLTDPKGDYDVKPEIKRLRGDFQRDFKADKELTQLTAIIAVLGTLTKPAKTFFHSIKSSLASEGIKLKLVEWSDIYHAMHALDSPADVNFDIEIHYDKDEDLMAHNDYCYLLAHAYDFYDAFRKHEWNLFEWNVRFQIPNSPINKRIVNALCHSKQQKSFHHYNNGLLITCRNYKKSHQKPHITLTGPQIINGCQTVRAICEAYDSLTPTQQEDFRKKTRVQVKVIKTTDLDFIGELVVTTNDQNPMNPRNLKSNSSEQREIQKQFRMLPQKWFYERKDGELKSLLAASSRVNWFKKSNFAVNPRRFRVISNEDLAKAWYSQ